jgi:colicin import membrane protein
VSLEIPAPEPQPPAPKPAPLAPEPAEVPPPAVPKPTAPVPTKTPVTDFKKKIVRDVIRAESKAKQEIKKERAAEKKRLEEEQKRISKAEFDRANKAKAPVPGKQAPTKVAKIDVEGIVKGVPGGSTANKVGGAGGKALTSDNDDVLAAYDALFKQRLRAAFEQPPGLSDSLKVTIEVRSHSDGGLSNPRVVKTSGSAEYDQAVIDAVRRVRMPVRPDHKTELVELIFTMRERVEG